MPNIKQLKQFLNLHMLLAGAIVYGIVMRLMQYFANRSYYGDEIHLLTNISERSVRGFFSTLDFLQRAPLGFLLIEKGMLMWWHSDAEWVMRAFPLVMGIASLFLFILWVRNVLDPIERVVGAVLISVSWPLIYYSADLKPYSTDLAAGLAISWMVSLVTRYPSVKLYWFLLALVGLLAIPLSFPATFVLAGYLAAAGIWLGAKTLRERALPLHFEKVLLVGGAWGLAFVLYYFLFIQLTSGNEPSQRFYWSTMRPAFLPLEGGAAIIWLIKVFQQAFAFPVGMSAAGEVALLLFLIGLGAMFTPQRKHLFFWLSPIVITLVASALWLYPFMDRLIVFLVPYLLLPVVIGVVSLVRLLKGVYPLAALLAVVFISFPSLYFAGSTISRQETRPILEVLSKQWQPGDVVFLDTDAQYAFEYYRKKYNFNPDVVIVSKYHRDSWLSYQYELQKLRGHSRVWLMVTQTNIEWNWGVDRRKLYVHSLNSLGIRQADYAEKEAYLYLYDLGDTAYRQAQQRLIEVSEKDETEIEQWRNRSKTDF